MRSGTAATAPARRRKPSASPPRRRRRPKPPVGPLDEATAYARDVVAGRIIACTFVRQACARHLGDLKSARRRGLRWDVAHADRATSFVRTLKHTKGAKAYFNLQPWQAFIVGSLFGWRRADGTRRFRTAYVEVPRKNGKSQLAAAIALYATFFDAPVEYGGRGYCAATKKDQAREVFGAAQTMIRRAPAHRAYVQVLKHVLARADTESTLLPLGADADTLDGLDPSFVCIDELHAHKTPALVEVMDSATGARSQPLQLEITTAGTDRTSICWKHHEYTLEILDPKTEVENDDWFGIVFTTDEGDKWDEEDTWRKANPNYGVSVKPDKIAGFCRTARRIPSSRDEFLQKILNQWRNAGDRAIQFATWDRGGEPFDPAMLAGRTCWIGLDLARQWDLSSAVAVFPPADDDPSWYALGRHYCPEENIERRSELDRVPYREFVRAGYLIATPGEVTDTDFILEDLKEWSRTFDLRELVYDEVFAAGLIDDLTEAGLKCVPQSQTAKAMILPTDEFMKLVRAGRLRHGGDPVMRWAAGNLVVRQGPTGGTAPDKKRSREKIDPMVAAIMAVGRAVLDEGPTRSVYEERPPMLL